MSLQYYQSEVRIPSLLDPKDWLREDRWFWVDEGCDEPMGPFNTKGEAEADYKSVRLKDYGND